MKATFAKRDNSAHGIKFGSGNTYQDNFENRELFSPLSQNYAFVCARPYENAKTMEIR